MVKLDVYCGILGCGKTTLIKQMLKKGYPGKRVALIENEIGKVNIDAEEFKEAQLQVTELTGGCVCCTIKGNFVQAIQKIIQEHSVDYIIIEPTGAADIQGLIEACSNITDAQLNRLVMLVNTKKLLKLLCVVGDFYKQQIQMADYIYLNFTEGLKSEEIQDAKEAIWNINPIVKLIDIPMSKVNQTTFKELKEFPMVPLKKGKYVKLLVEEAQGKSLHAKIERPGQQKLKTWSYTFEKLCTHSKLQKIKETLQNSLSGEIWRGKGLLRMDTGELRKLDITFGDFFEEDREDSQNPSVGTFVIIGKKLNTNYLETVFSQIDKEG